jgi:hypothetical protein
MIHFKDEPNVVELVSYIPSGWNVKDPKEGLIDDSDYYKTIEWNIDLSKNEKQYDSETYEIIKIEKSYVLISPSVNEIKKYSFETKVGEVSESKEVFVYPSEPVQSNETQEENLISPYISKDVSLQQLENSHYLADKNLEKNNVEVVTTLSCDIVETDPDFFINITKCELDNVSGFLQFNETTNKSQLTANFSYGGRKNQFTLRKNSLERVPFSLNYTDVSKNINSTSLMLKWGLNSSTVSVTSGTTYRVTSSDNSALNSPWYSVDFQRSSCSANAPCGGESNITIFDTNIAVYAAANKPLYGAAARSMDYANSTLIESGPVRVLIQFDNRTGNFNQSTTFFNWTQFVYAYPRYYLNYYVFTANNSFRIGSATTAPFSVYQAAATAANNPRFDEWNNRTINGTNYLFSVDVGTGADTYNLGLAGTTISFLFDDADHNKTILYFMTQENFTQNVQNQVYQDTSERIRAGFYNPTSQAASTRDFGYAVMFGRNGLVAVGSNQSVWNNDFAEQYSAWYNPATITAYAGISQGRNNVTSTYNLTANSTNDLDFNFTTGTSNYTYPVFHVRNMTNIDVMVNYIYWKNYSNSSNWVQLTNDTDFVLQEGNSDYFGYNYILVLINKTLGNGTSQTYEFWISNNSLPFSDVVAPTYSSNSTNNTLVAQPTKFVLNWFDAGVLSGYVFSLDNCTGSMVNESWASFSGTWSNVTRTINSTSDCNIRWCVYANDSSNNWNGTSCSDPFNFVTTLSLPVDFISQTPADIDTFNVISTNLNATYSISSVNGINNGSSRIWFKTNTTSSDIQAYVNGTAISGYRTTARYNNTSSYYYFFLNDNDIYPATYNYNQSQMASYPKSSFLVDDPTEWVKIEFYNVSNTKQYGFFEVYADNVSSSSNDLMIVYCNSSYTTGSPHSSGYCTDFGYFNKSLPFNHSHGANSFHRLETFAINTTDNTMNGIKVTSKSYFLLHEMVLSGSGWNIYYIADISRPSAAQTSVTDGISWSDLSGTVDAHLHQYDGTDTFYYYVCGNDTFNNMNCSSVRNDLLNLTGLPPTSPDFSSPADGTYSGSIWINYTASISPNGYNITSYNLSLVFPNLTFVKSIYNTTGLSYLWNSSMENGDYRIRVQANDNMSQYSYGYSEAFTINNYPQYSDNSTNSTMASSLVEHRLRWQDETGLSGYIFSFYNGSNTTWGNQSSDLQAIVQQMKTNVSAPITTDWHSPSSSNKSLNQWSYSDRVATINNQNATSQTPRYATNDWYNFNMGIPEGSTIYGINVKVMATRANTSSPTSSWNISNNGGSIWVSLGVANPAASSWANYTFGGNSSLFGRTWNSTILNDTTGNLLIIKGNKTSTTPSTIRVDWIGMLVNYSTPTIDGNTSNVTYNGILPGTVLSAITNISMTVNVSSYNNTGSNGESSNPDLYLSVWDGSVWNEVGNFSITLTGNKTLYVPIQNNIYTAWLNESNRNISIKGRYFDYNDMAYDEINYTDVWVVINSTTDMFNDTWTPMTGTGNWSNVTKRVNSTLEAAIIWCVYANDSSNNWNSGCFNYTLTEPELGYLEVELVSPSGNFIIEDYNNFTVNATVYCRGGLYCGNVYGTVRYNLTSNNPDTPVNTTFGDVPFFVNETPAYALKTCLNNMQQDESCSLAWNINATGTDTEWKVGVLFNSSYGVKENNTDNITVTIISCIEGMSLDFSKVSFGILPPSSIGNQALENSIKSYNVTNSGSCISDFWIKSTNLVNGTAEILYSNISFNNVTNDYGSSYRIGNGYSTPNSTLKKNVAGSTNITSYYFLDVPAIYSGNYSGSITFCINSSAYPTPCD